MYLLISSIEVLKRVGSEVCVDLRTLGTSSKLISSLTIKCTKLDWCQIFKENHIIKRFLLYIVVTLALSHWGSLWNIHINEELALFDNYLHVHWNCNSFQIPFQILDALKLGRFQNAHLNLYINFDIFWRYYCGVSSGGKYIKCLEIDELW